MGNSIDKILPGLYVGGIRAASKEQILNENNITHILSIHERAAPLHKGRQYLCINANDNTSQNLSQYFQECNDFIHQARLNGGNVLVHCFAGISRSVTVTVAYIVTVTDLSWREVLKAVRGARNCANPNFGFQRQLVAFYHDDLQEEKKRLLTKFPTKLEYKDEEECRRLITAHEHWVKYGDDGPVEQLNNADYDSDEQNTYPLAHNAYKEMASVENQVPQSSDESVLKDLPGKVSTSIEEHDGRDFSYKLENNDDEDDDEAYIDMSKNSFQKPQLKNDTDTPPVKEGNSGNLGANLCNSNQPETGGSSATTSNDLVEFDNGKSTVYNQESRENTGKSLDLEESEISVSEPSNSSESFTKFTDKSISEDEIVQEEEHSSQGNSNQIVINDIFEANFNMKR